MRKFWSSLKFWITDTIASRGHAVKAPDSLARTIKDASHVRGGGVGGGGGLSRAASEEVLKHAADGHEQYQKSFEKDS